MDLDSHPQTPQQQREEGDGERRRFDLTEGATARIPARTSPSWWGCGGVTLLIKPYLGACLHWRANTEGNTVTKKKKKKAQFSAAPLQPSAPWKAPRAESAEIRRGRELVSCHSQDSPTRHCPHRVSTGPRLPPDHGSTETFDV